jgi:hypothetical protein
MFVVVVGTIVAFMSLTFTSTVEPWITSPFVGLTICTFAGLLGRSAGGVPAVEPFPEEHAPTMAASVAIPARTARRRVEDPGTMWRHLRVPDRERREAVGTRVPPAT